MKFIAFFVLLLAFEVGHSQTLVTGQPEPDASVAVSGADLELDPAIGPQEFKAFAFTQPEKVSELAANMYIRRVLAAAAVKQGLAQTAAMQAQLENARTRVLSDAFLAQYDEKNVPTPLMIEDYAATQYRTNPKKFQAPESVHVGHILISLQQENAKAKALDLHAQLRQGASFEQLAKEHSQDPGTAAKGGDLGFMERGKMVKPFEDAAFALSAPGDLSDVVETQFGFHILRLLEKRPERIKPFSEVKEALVKQSQAILQNNARLALRDKILKDANFDQAAIAAFSKRYAEAKREQSQPIGSESKAK